MTPIPVTPTRLCVGTARRLLFLRRRHELPTAVTLWNPPVLDTGLRVWSGCTWNSMSALAQVEAAPASCLWLHVRFGTRNPGKLFTEFRAFLATTAVIVLDDA